MNIDKKNRDARRKPGKQGAKKAIGALQYCYSKKL